MLKTATFEFNLFGVNTYIVWDPETHEAAIIDPGMQTQDDNDLLAGFIKENGLHPAHLVNTHLHIDHTLGDYFVEKTYGLDLEASSADSFLGENLEAQAAMFHLNLGTLKALHIGHLLADGDTITVGTDELQVIAVPGHSPGSIALYSPSSRFVITGDALFRGSIGRTDLPGGDGDTLRRAIRGRLLTLPADTKVLPGHGPATMIATERSSNPWV